MSSVTASTSRPHGQIGTPTRPLDELLGGDAARVELVEGGPEHVEVPLLRVALGGLVGDVRLDGVVHEEEDLGAQVLAVQDAAPLPVDEGALPVEDLVELEDVLTGLEVLLLDLGLGGGDGAGDHLGLDGHGCGDVRHRHDAVDELGAEQAHQVVLQRQVEAGRPGSPWRPERPRSWLSMRRDSCRSVPRT